MKTAHTRPTGMLLALIVLGTVELCAQETSSVENKELRIALDAALERNRELEQKNRILASGNAALGESLSAANAIAEERKKEYDKMLLHLEALGAESIDFESNGMQNRLKHALSDLNLIEKERQRLAETMLMLRDTISDYLKTAISSSAEERLKVEKAMRETDFVLGLTTKNDPTRNRSVAGARVISVKEDLSLVVGNVGRIHGMRIGTPVRFQRLDRVLGHGKIIDVRDNISGIFVSSMLAPDEKLKVSDSIHVDSQKTTVSEN